MHDGSVFTELSLVIVATAVVSLVMTLLRQPLILGYIIAGIIVGPVGLSLIHSKELFETFSTIGITLLLFIIGLGMNVSELRKLGRVVMLTALSSLVFIMSLGFGASTLLGYGTTESLIIGLALFFSSTIIILKLLSDKKEQNRLHGQIAIGVILIEDIVATIALLFVFAGKTGGGFDSSQLVLLGAKAFFLLTLLVICSTKVLPKVARYMASSQELLFLFAIGWGFGIASLFELAGFSIEIGALFAGVSLASSPYVQEIASRLKPLRDFFIVLFFITLGQSMSVDNLNKAVVPAIILSLIVIIGKPIVISSTVGLLGYTKRVCFKAGVNLSQISEFSIVLVVLAAGSGIVRPELSAVITLVAIITIAVSTYLMKYDDELFVYFDKLKIGFLEKQAIKKDRRLADSYPMVLLGYHHGGHEFIRTFKQLGKRFLVIDYDPEVIDALEKQKINYLYGDITDIELLKEMNLEKSKLIVSTVPDHDSNIFIVKFISSVNSEAILICYADNIHQATELYDLGASYVMMPHYIGSEKISAFIRKSGVKKSDFLKYRDKHLSYLQGHFAAIVD